MADQKKWFKVWSTILFDPHHANLSLEDVGRWTRLGAMIVATGEAGKIEIIPPAKTFLAAMECNDLLTAKRALSRLPNVQIDAVHEEGRSDNGTFTVIMHNWFKYQVDSTAYERVKRSRYKRRGEVDVEKKREEKIPPNPPTSLPSATSTATANGDAAKARAMLQKAHPKPGHYDTPEDEIMGAEEFAKIKASLHTHQAAEEPQEVAVDDVF